MVLRTALLIGVVSALSACANNNVLYNPHPQRMSLEDLNYFKYDCPHSAEQRKFLQTQLSYIPMSELNSPERAIILNLLSRIKNNCGTQESQLEGCLYVQEDLPSGPANAVMCNDPRHLAPREIPVINHWDPLVDMK